MIRKSAEKPTQDKPGECEAACADAAFEFISPASFWIPARPQHGEWTSHIPFLLWLVDALRPSAIVEIGTQRGDVFGAFCQAVQALRLPAKCFAIDRWEEDALPGDSDRKNLSTHLTSASACEWAGISTVTRAPVEGAFARFEAGSIDLLHVNGRHVYAAFIQEFESWLPKLSKRGVIVLHDLQFSSAELGMSGFWKQIKRNWPHFELIHGEGLAVLGIGSEPSEKLARLFGICDERTAGEVRANYARLGAALQMEESAGVGERGESETMEFSRDRVLQLELKGREREARLKMLEAVISAKDDSVKSAKKQASLQVETLKKSASWRATEWLRRIERNCSWKAGLAANLQTEAAIACGGLLARAPLTPGLRKLKSDADRIAKSGLFDDAFYRELYGPMPGAMGDPILHYLLAGVKAGCKPNMYFDTRWYLSEYPEAAASGENPLLDYLDNGGGGQRDPGPHFDAAQYVIDCPAAANPGQNPLRHHLTCLRAQEAKMEGKSPSNVDLLPFFESTSSVPLQYEDPKGEMVHALLIGHEATHTGAPLVLLCAAREFIKTGRVLPKFFLCASGRMTGQYVETAPTLQKSTLEMIYSKPVDAARILKDWFLTQPGRKIVICNTVVMHEFASVFGETGIPVISWIHEFVTFNRAEIGVEIMQMLSRKCARIVFPANVVEKGNREAFDLDPAKTRVIRYGGDHAFKAYEDTTSCDALLSKLGITPEMPVILGCGTAETRKGADLFVQVAAKVISRFAGRSGDKCMPHFIWVGSDTNPTAMWCRHDAEFLGLEGRIHFVGLFSNPGEFYKRASLFMLTSREETGPLVAFEAVRSRTPLVGFRGATGLAEFHELDDCMVPYLDLDAMADRIVDVLENPERYAEKAKEKAAWISETLQWRKTAVQMLDLVEEVLAEKAPAKKDPAAP